MRRQKDRGEGEGKDAEEKGLFEGGRGISWKKGR